MPRTGYTLPVFAVAAAKAALIYLLENKDSKLSIAIDLLPETADIPIEQIATLDSVTALAITKSDPGDNLDLTKNTPIWTWVKLIARTERALILEAGEGLGKTSERKAAIYQYARRLFDANLLPLIPSDRTAVVRIILPEGRKLAQRTSNEAFGILEGLALLGTSGISQPVSTVDRLEEFRSILQDKVKECPDLVFCLGSNGQQVAQRLSIPEQSIVMTGNWIGALLVEAGLYKARSILFIGYQGKLIKLAAGIFNTSSHIADAKLETIAAAVVQSCRGMAMPCPCLEIVESVLNAQTADAAYKILKEKGLADRVFTNLAQQISQNAESYVQKYANVSLKVGTILFDRRGEIIGQSI
jgi:cobalt-precorrin-5B (C1)-methyltransferase